MSRLSPPPPGKSPAEYTYHLKDSEGSIISIRSDLSIRTASRYSSGHSAGESPEGEASRVELDPDELDRFLESLDLRFSYFIADQLIALGMKQARYRDDAFSDDWREGTQKLLFELACPGEVSIEEMQEAIRAVLSMEKAEHVRRPLDLTSFCADLLQAAIRSGRSAKTSDPPQAESHQNGGTC